MHGSTLRIAARYYRQFPTADPLGAAEEVLDLPIEETVFLLVDVYGLTDARLPVPSDLPDIYRPVENDPVQAIVRDRIVPAKAAAKRSGLKVVYVTNHLSEGLSDGSEWRNLSIRTCGVDVLEAWRPPTPILEHAPYIAPSADEPVIRKQLYSGFFETNLDSTLRGFGARNLVVVGFASLICLGTTVTEAMYRNYRVVVLRDAIHTREYPETKEGGWANFIAVRLIESTVGYTATTSQFIEACEASSAAQARRTAS